LFDVTLMYTPPPAFVAELAVSVRLVRLRLLLPVEVLLVTKAMPPPLVLELLL
jgi:hypothetical protein